MDTLTILGSIVIVVIVAFLVGFPMIKNDTQSKVKTLLAEAEAVDSMTKDKEAVLTSINEIEFDYKMKKLSDDDYEILKNKYKEAALEILHEEEKEEFTPSNVHGKNRDYLQQQIEDEIERELQIDKR